jgi:hypothetical protein
MTSPPLSKLDHILLENAIRKIGGVGLEIGLDGWGDMDVGYEAENE